jgi:PAS domain S-box-containing protein
MIERRRRAAAIPLHVFLLIAVTAAAALAAAAVSVPGAVHAASDAPSKLLVFASVALLLQFVAIDIYGRGSVSASSTGILATGLAIGPGAAMTVAAVAAVIRLVTNRGLIHRGVFDAANLALAGAAGSAAYSLAGSSVVAKVGVGVLCGLLYYAVNTGLLTLAMALSERVSPYEVWSERFRWMLPYAVASGPLAAGLVVAYDRVGAVGVFIFAIPPAFMLISARQYLTRTRESVEEIRRVNEDLESANAQLAASEDHFRSLIEDAADAIVVLDRRGRIRYGSPALERMLGQPAGRIVDDLALRYVHAADRRRATDAIMQVANAPLAHALELRLDRTDGSTVAAELTARPFREAAGDEALVVTLRDITARKHAEDALTQTQLELHHSQKLEAVGRLAGGVAHDFNNLLTVIIGCSEFLKLRLPPGDPSYSDAEEISRAGQRAATLTRELLAFSRKQTIEPRPHDLNQTLAGLGSMLPRLAGDSIAIFSEPTRRVAPVFADPGKLEQIIVNLVVNARDAIGEDEVAGRITVAIRETDVGPDSSAAPAPGRWIELSVADNGAGMNAETQARVFEPFYTTKAVGKGTGLGLSTVYGIVQQSGGTIALESALGSGTTFRIYLPLYEGPLPAEEVAPESTLDAGDATILLADDDDAVRRYATAVLEEHGYRVLGARNGADAIDLANALDRPIDLLLTDVVMPCADGVAAADALTSARPDIRVLYMSGNVGETRVPSEQLLQKPFIAAELIDAVRKALERAPATVATPVG